MDSPKPRLDELRIERPAVDSRQSRGGLLWLLVLVLGIAAVAVAWWRLRPGVPEVQIVEAQPAASASGDRTVLNASGYVTARREATVSSKVTGKVTEVLVEEGMTVKQGQVLARLDDTNIKAALRLAEAQFASATNALAEIAVRIEEARLEFRRQANLLTNRIATMADYERAEAGLKALEARLQKQVADIAVAEREVASWQQQLDDTIIRAPFGGVVTSKNAQPGEMISPISAGGGFTRTGICTIVDMTSLEVEVDVNESYIGRVQAGQPVQATLDAYPEWKIPSKVIAIIPTADRQKSTVRVRVGFDKLEPRILPEMSVKVAFRQSSGDGEPAAVRTTSVLVPKDAVRAEQGKDYVFVVRENRAERRAVSVASTDGGQSLVTAGLNAGERIVVGPAQNLADGTKVRVLTP